MCLKWHTHKQTKIGMNAELRLIIFNDCCTGGPKGHSKLTLFEVLNELCVLKPCLITLQHYLNIIVFLWWSRNVFSAQFYCLMFCQTQNNATNHNNSIYNATQNTTLHTVWGVPPWGPYYLLCVIKLLQCSVTHSQSVSSHARVHSIIITLCSGRKGLRKPILSPIPLSGPQASALRCGSARFTLLENT